MYYYYAMASSKTPVYKYFNQARPETFVGMQYDQLVGKEMSIIRGDYRYKYKSNLYIKLSANVAYHYRTEMPNALYTNPFRPIFGAGAGLIYVTPIGPAELFFAVGDKTIIGPREAQTMWTVKFGYAF